MSIYEKTNVARALLYWSKNNNGNECYYLEDRMYAVADGDMVVILTADSYDEAKRKAKARHTQERPQGEWIITGEEQGAFGIIYKRRKCNRCGWESSLLIPKNFCPKCGVNMKGGAE